LKTKTISQKVVIPSASPEEVYDVLMDSEKHTAVTGSAASIDPKVGGKFTAWDGYIFGKNLELERGKKIVQEWMTTEWPESYSPSLLKLTFTKVKDGTEITVVHSNVPADDAAAYDKGWYEFYWDPMKLYFKR
jgi:activator of HSP90 ATPase